jgi:hypothetical protein
MVSTLARFESSEFLPVGPLSSLSYSAPADNEETLYRRFVDGCQIIPNYPVISERMLRSMVRLVEARIESYGRQFQHSLFVNVFFQL